MLERGNREPLSAVDAAWLRMDGPTNLMMITGVLLFDEPLDPLDAEAMLHGLLRHPRFRQRLAPSRLPLGRVAWEDDPYFDLASHVHRVALPAPGDQAELARFVSDRMSTPLDRSRPLWQADIVQGVGGGSALVVRLHHCIADGIALVRVLLGLTDEGQVFAPVVVGLPPAVTPTATVDWAKREVAQARTLARLLFLPPDPSTILKGDLSPRKAAAWSGPVPLAKVRGIAAVHQAKTNDVLVAAVAGALRAYLADHAALRAGKDFRALVPVYLRGPNGELGNHFGLVFLDLPIGEPDRATRLRLVKERMDVIKAAPDAPVAFGVLGALGILSPSIEHFGVDLFTQKATILVTNVPGPPAPIHLAGKAVSSLMVWAPTSGSIGVGISLLSYAGAIRLGLAVDTALVPDPQAIVQAFERELEALAG